MLKLIFIVLVVANLAALGYSKGYMGPIDEHEPERVKQQILPESIKLVAEPNEPQAVAKQADTLAITASLQNTNKEESRQKGASVASTKETAARCISTDFLDNPRATALIEKIVEAGIPAEKIAQTTTGSGNFLVYIAEQNGKTGAIVRAKQLRSLGITDFYIMRDSNILPWAVSLGVFRTEQAALTQMIALKAKGVEDLRIKQFKAKTALTIESVTPNQAAAISKIAMHVNNSSTHPCL